MRRYLLPAHTYVAFLHDGVIFLDLERDKYRGVGAEDAAAVTQALRHCQSDALDSSALTVCEDLVQRGLLTSNPHIGKPVTQVQVRAPACALIQDGDRPVAHISFWHVVNVLVSIAKSIVKLKWGVIHAVKPLPARVVPSAVELDALRDLVQVFRDLTPIFYVAHERCLFNAVVLREFLHRYGIDTDLVIGVRAGPFAAHSWVLYQDYVLTDRAEYIKSFTPIAAA